MIINETYRNFDLISPVSHTFLGRDGKIIEEEESVLVEHQIDVYINEKLTMKLVCIPQYLTELILGRLLTEGIIAGVDEIETINICESGRRARVFLHDQTTNPTKNFVETTQSCCTSNHILNDDFISHREVRKVTPIPWKADWIFALADKFAAGMPIHSKTWSTHSAFLACEDNILFECEDIGRHNALDKAIGYALRHDIAPGKCILYSSGRIPTDMVMKAIRSGIPILASKASLTKEAVELAKEYDLTLVCAARRDRMKIYTGRAPESPNP